MKIKGNYIGKKDSRAFTLVELLATIAILGLVISITVFTGIRLIKNGREKTYQTTKNNIERYANNYLVENGDRLFYLSKNDKSDIEYQCVTLKNLIDTGYFDTKLLDSKVAEGISPKESDYVYIERDIRSKSIKKNVYIQSFDNEYKKTCDGAVKAEMDIAFLIDTGDKDRVARGYYKTVDITIIYKLKNANNINDYEYGYEYSNDKIELLKDNGNEKVVRVSDNGTLIGMINYLREKAYEDSIIIDMIDNDGTIITLGDYKKGFVRGETSVNLNVYDEKIGVDGSSFTRDDIIVTVGDKKVDTNDLNLTDIGNDNYKLTVKNKQYDGKVVISIDKGKVLDKLGNGNDAVKVEPDITFDNKKPTCSLNVNNTTIIGNYNDDESGIEYYGYSSSMNETSNANKTINSTGTYVFYVKDKAGNTNSCSLEVIGTNSKQECSGYKTTVSGTCTCERTVDNSGTAAVVENGTCVGYHQCKCKSSGARPFDFYGCKSSRVCTKYTTSYNCVDGYTKINNNYCYKNN